MSSEVSSLNLESSWRQWKEDASEEEHFDRLQAYYLILIAYRENSTQLDIRNLNITSFPDLRPLSNLQIFDIRGNSSLKNRPLLPERCKLIEEEKTGPDEHWEKWEKSLSSSRKAKLVLFKMEENARTDTSMKEDPDYAVLSEWRNQASKKELSTRFRVSQRILEALYQKATELDLSDLDKLTSLPPIRIPTLKKLIVAPSLLSLYDENSLKDCLGLSEDCEVVTEKKGPGDFALPKQRTFDEHKLVETTQAYL